LSKPAGLGDQATQEVVSARKRKERGGERSTKVSERGRNLSTPKKKNWKRRTTVFWKKGKAGLEDRKGTGGPKGQEKTGDDVNLAGEGEL